MTFAVEVAKQDSDPRSYVERMFFNLQDGKKVTREVLLINCDEETPKDSEIPNNSIVVMKKYKNSNIKGKKDALQGETVIFIPSEKGKVVVPLDQMAEFRDLLGELETVLNESPDIIGE